LILSSSRVSLNNIGSFVASVIARYSASHVDSDTALCFFVCHWISGPFHAWYQRKRSPRLVRHSPMYLSWGVFMRGEGHIVFGCSICIPSFINDIPWCTVQMLPSSVQVKMGWKVWRPARQVGGDTRYFCDKQLLFLLLDNLCSSAAVSNWFSDVSEKRRASRILHSNVNGMSSHRHILLSNFRMQNIDVRRSAFASCWILSCGVAWFL
jgi:hypothetical protein